MTRRGVGLVEVLITLTVLALTATLWMRTLVAQDRQQRTTQHHDRSRRAVDDVMRVLTATVRAIPAGDTLSVLGDTALEFRRSVGLSVSCAAFSDSVQVPAEGPEAQWDARPDSGDVAVVIDAQGLTTQHAVVSVGDRAPSARCSRAAWLLRLSPVRSASFETAVAVRVLRRVRLMVYRAGDGQWWFGERLCGPHHLSACGAAQPIAGPLPTPRGGLLLTTDGPQLRAVLRDGAQLRRASVTRVP